MHEKNIKNKQKLIMTRISIYNEIAILKNLKRCKKKSYFVIKILNNK